MSNPPTIGQIRSHTGETLANMAQLHYLATHTW